MENLNSSPYFTIWKVSDRALRLFAEAVSVHFSCPMPFPHMTHLGVTLYLAIVFVLGPCWDSGPTLPIAAPYSQPEFSRGKSPLAPFQKFPTPLISGCPLQPCSNPSPLPHRLLGSLGWPSGQWFSQSGEQPCSEA